VPSWTLSPSPVLETTRSGAPSPSRSPTVTDSGSGPTL
jgi:hypothetical protein